MRFSATWVLLPAILVAATPLSAGEEGRVEGTVRDPLGKPVTDAWVAARPLEREVQVDARTNRKGEFELFLEDATGSWFIQIRKEGFRTLKEPLQPVVGGTLSRSWILVAGADEEEDPEAAAAAEAANRAAAFYNQGAEAFNVGDLEAAREGFQAALEANPDLAAAHAALMRLYFAQRKFPEAASSAGRLLALEPGNVLALRVRHDALLETGDEAGAAQILARLVEVDATPGTARRVFNTGVHAYQRDDFDTALERFEKALALDPDLTPARQALAGLLFGLGRIAEAVPHADRLAAEETARDDAGVQTVLFAVYRAAGNAEKARGAFDRLRELDPAGLVARLLEEGEEAFKADRVEEAAARFKLLLEVEPEHPRATYSLGLCALNQGDVAEGRRLLERFLQLAPDDPEAAAARKILAGI